MPTLTYNNGILDMPKDPQYEPDPSGFGVHCFNKMKEFSDQIGQIEYYTKMSDTYGEIRTKSVRVALKMKSLGITDEDIVSLCTGTHRETCLPFWASLFMGVKLANLHTLLTISDMKYLTNLTKPKLIFSAPESVEKLEVVIKELELDARIVVFGETEKHIAFKEFLEPQEGEEEFQPKLAESLFDTVSILYSSGTTGLPKGICLTHYGLLYTMNLVKDYFDFKSVLYFATPYWITYYIMIPSALISAGQLVLCRFDEKTILETTQDYKVTFTVLMPSFAHAITAHTENYTAEYDTSSLTSMMIGGGCISSDQIDKIKKIFPKCSVSQIYGSTETSGLISSFNYKNEPELLLKKATSCGRLLPGMMCKVVDIDTNEVLGPNKSGELLIKSKRLMSGYYNDPEKTAEVFDEDGFLRTGDVVYYDENYCFYVVDRIKEMFKYQFWHIVPAELENVLSQHPGVKEVLVIGYPHEVDENHPMAVIVPHNGVDFSADDILKYCNDQVSDIKKLRGGVKFVKTLPKTATGKYSRKILRSMVINNEI